MDMENAKKQWRFFRAGGFDQVRLDTADDLLAVGQLDQKLWVALSCPIQGVHFDTRTLALVDSDNDGHVRAPELIEAILWVGQHLANPELLVQRPDGLGLSAIRTDLESGEKIAAAARQVLADLGKTESEAITIDEASNAQALYAARQQAAWEAAGQAVRPLGEASEPAYAALQAVSSKIDDFFLRCRLASFDERAGETLAVSDETLKILAADPSSSAEAISKLPLVKVAPQAPIPLTHGINPAWEQAVAEFNAKVVQPLLGSRLELTEQDWQSLKSRFSPYGAWLAEKPAPDVEDENLRELERLVRYVRHLLPLANNFVAFKDFYTRQGKAMFQAGTLYLDGRSCDLCVQVTDPGRHALLATLARICLVYCDCVRGKDKMTIAAAFTAGDSDQLLVGRNGVFYDRLGNDWDATIVKIIDHPISLRQAFWDPYKRFVRMVGQQLQKLAASKAKESDDRLTLAATNGAKKVAGTDAKQPAPAAQQAFDVGKFAGIFAAIGLALGAIGTALASVVMGVLSLKWWQMPLVFLGLMLLISGPAVILAWFKLRSRNLGPILDANGWAVNARARINIPFGTSLTQAAQLPPNAERSMVDPYAEKRPSPILVGLLLGVILIAFAAVWYLTH
jgi:hypothetical protein